MLIRDLFQASVTRDIPPVVYFHEDSPGKLEAEVSEYIITGGYLDGDPRARRVRHGIHDQYVRLLRAMAAEIGKPGGPELPACWISGFYGSGKSSFAKLLGLALDGRVLASGRSLAEALLAQDTSPRGQELVDAWHELTALIEPLSVVFDIGSVARDEEHIHSAVVRQLRTRLGYCSTSSLVAAHELKLERDEEWERFLAVAEATLGRPWAQMKDRQQADDDFSHVLHVHQPDRYPEPMEWLDSRAGASHSAGTAVIEAVDDIEAMMSIRAPGKTLFFVVDEVSQYVHGNTGRMLKLQSLVEELGKRLKGSAWLLVTGQQKLEDATDVEVLGKLKDRFPAKLRVHLSPANIRDVVHRRLLAKKLDSERLLRDLFQRHRAELKLHAYDCEEITEEDFVEVYPMLPGHIELLLRITTNLGARSSRVQGDSHAIRGLLQLLGELFREQKLADREVGHLVTLDAIYEVLHTALDADVQNTMSRLFERCAKRGDETAARSARAVALLELVSDQQPTTSELVAACLYARLGARSARTEIEAALEGLRNDGLLGYSEKHGYKIQSSAGQQWQKDRDDIRVGYEQRSAAIQESLAVLMADASRPQLGERRFPWRLRYTDGRAAHDVALGKDVRDAGVVTVDFQDLGGDSERAVSWVPRSDEGAFRNRIVWVVGDRGELEDLARRLGKSQAMVRRHQPRRSSLSTDKQRLLAEEEARSEELATELRRAVAEAFLHGNIYFRGQRLVPRQEGGSFATAIHNVANRLLSHLYDRFTEIAVTETELFQLLEKELQGPSFKFLDKGDGLGILSLDAGKYLASCEGAIPARVLAFVTEQKGISGANLLTHFGGPPYGYGADVVKACVAGLLRGGKVRVRAESGDEATSVQDPGMRDLFRRDRDFKKADIFPDLGKGIDARARVRICRFFSDCLGVEMDRDNDLIADAVYQHFPGQREALRQVESLIVQLPGRPGLPPALERLVTALEDCRRSRQVEDTVRAVDRNLDALRDGIEQLGLYRAELTEEAIQVLRGADAILAHQFEQLDVLGASADLEGAADKLRAVLESERPWRAIGDIAGPMTQINESYEAERSALLGGHEEEAEAARNRLMSRPGFERLDDDQVHRVLRPIGNALWDTSADAIAPSLAELRDQFPARLERAVLEANDLLDRELEKDEGPVVAKVAMSLRGREITDDSDLEALLAEIRERIEPLLGEKKRIRFV